MTAVKELPRRLLVLGGGAIGCEMEQALRRLGCAQVTVVEALDRLLAQEETFAGAQVRDAFEAGRHHGDHRRPHDRGVPGLGRRPATGDLGLEVVGLEPGRFIPVDDQFRVSGHDWLYAVGDCNGRSLLTHMGKHQARLAGDGILGRQVADLAWFRG